MRPAGHLRTLPRWLEITRHPDYAIDEKRCVDCGKVKDAICFGVEFRGGHGSRLAVVCLQCQRAAGVRE